MYLFYFISITALFHLTSAQFDFFGNFFAQQQQQQHQQPDSGISQWETHAETVACSQYLCSGTLTCVARPSDCPCPSPEDIKCTIPDGENREDATVVCTRGQEECIAVARLMRKL